MVSGQDLVRQLEQLPVDRNSRPLQDAMISSCGELVRQVKGNRNRYKSFHNRVVTRICFPKTTVKKVKDKKASKKHSSSSSGSESSDEEKSKKKKRSKKSKKKNKSKSE